MAEVAGAVAGPELDVVVVAVAAEVVDAGRRWIVDLFVVAAGRLVVGSWDLRDVDTPG